MSKLGIMVNKGGAGMNWKFILNNKGELNREGKVVNPLAINHAIQKELDRLEALIKETKKTWVVIEWQVYNYNANQLPPLYLNSKAITVKTAEKLLCIETGETKEI